MSLFLRVEQDCLPEKVFKFFGFEQEFGQDVLGTASQDPVDPEFRVFVINNNYYYQVSNFIPAKLIKSNGIYKTERRIWRFLHIPEKQENRITTSFKLDLRFGFFNKQIKLFAGERYLLGQSSDTDICVSLADIPDKYFYLYPHNKTITIEILSGSLIVNNRKIYRRARVKCGDSIKLLPLGLKVNIERA